MKPRVFKSVEEVRNYHPVVYRAMKSPGGMAQAVVELANLNEVLMEKLTLLDSYAPKVVKANGQRWIWHCPDHLIPDPTP